MLKNRRGILLAGCCCREEWGRRGGGDEGETQRWEQETEEGRQRNRAAEADGLVRSGRREGLAGPEGDNYFRLRF